MKTEDTIVLTITLSKEEASDLIRDIILSKEMPPKMIEELQDKFLENNYTDLKIHIILVLFKVSAFWFLITCKRIKSVKI